MKLALLSFSLALAAVYTPYHVDDVAIRTAIASTLNCIPSMEIGVAPTNQREVHAVVVDMPQRASLEYASPDTWGALPTFDPPEEESPTKPVLQVAPGCSALEIIAITGHKTLKEVERYTKDADQERMAERAIARTPSYPREVPSYPREKKA